MGTGTVPGPLLRRPAPHAPAGQRRVVQLIAWLSLVALLSTASSWAALALALRSLESVWHDRVEALAFLHETMLPLERAVPALLTARSGSVKSDERTSDSVTVRAADVERLRVARAGAADAWRRYLATTLTAEEARITREVRPAVERALGAADSLATTLAHPDAATRASAFELLRGVVLPTFEASTLGLERLVALQRTETRQQVELARARYGLARTTLTASVVATLLMLTAVLATTRGARTPWRRR